MKRVLLPFIIIAMLSVNVINALEIEQVGVYNFGVAYDVVVKDDIAYLSGNDGADIFDITDKTGPIKLTRITNSPYGAQGLDIFEDTLYVSATSNPEITATVQGNPRVYKIHAVDDTLYIGEVNQGLLVYDITDPTKPMYIRTVSGTTGIFDIDSLADTLYLGCHGNGVKILDITDRQNPELVGTYNNGGEAYGICIVNSLLIVADLQQGIELLDVSNPRTPTLAASWTTTHPHEIAGDTEYVYLADQDDGLEIFIYGEDVEPVEIKEPEIEQEEENSIPIYTWHIVTGLMISVTLLKKHAHQRIP